MEVERLDHRLLLSVAPPGLADARPPAPPAAMAPVVPAQDPGPDATAIATPQVLILANPPPPPAGITPIDRPTLAAAVAAAAASGDGDAILVAASGVLAAAAASGDGGALAGQPPPANPVSGVASSPPGPAPAATGGALPDLSNLEKLVPGMALPEQVDTLPDRADVVISAQLGRRATTKLEQVPLDPRTPKVRFDFKVVGPSPGPVERLTILDEAGDVLDSRTVGPGDEATIDIDLHALNRHLAMLFAAVTQSDAPPSSLPTSNPAPTTFVLQVLRSPGTAAATTDAVAPIGVPGLGNGPGGAAAGGNATAIASIGPAAATITATTPVESASIVALGTGDGVVLTAGPLPPVPTASPAPLAGLFGALGGPPTDDAGESSAVDLARLDLPPSGLRPPGGTGEEVAGLPAPFPSWRGRPRFPKAAPPAPALVLAPTPAVPSHPTRRHPSAPGGRRLAGPVGALIAASGLLPFDIALGRRPPRRRRRGED